MALARYEARKTAASGPRALRARRRGRATGPPSPPTRGPFRRPAVPPHAPAPACAGRSGLVPRESQEVAIRNDQGGKKAQRVEDVVEAERCVADRIVRNRSRDQRDPKAEVGELSNLVRNARDDQRENAENLGGGGLDLEVVGEMQMIESPLFSVGEREVVVEY